MIAYLRLSITPFYLEKLHYSFSRLNKFHRSLAEYPFDSQNVGPTFLSNKES
jgi:hypothetical protein